MEKTCTEKVTAATPVAQSEFVPFTRNEYFHAMKNSSLELRLEYFKSFLLNYRPPLKNGFVMRRNLWHNGRPLAPTFFNNLRPDDEESYRFFRDIIYNNTARNKKLVGLTNVRTNVIVDDYLVFSWYSDAPNPDDYVIEYAFIK